MTAEDRPDLNAIDGGLVDQVMRQRDFKAAHPDVMFSYHPDPFGGSHHRATFPPVLDPEDGKVKDNIGRIGLQNLLDKLDELFPQDSGVPPPG